LLAPLQRAEMGVASHLLRLLQGEAPWGARDPVRAMPWVEQHTGRTLSPSQREVVALALRRQVTVITGGLGAGKRRW
jgi:exodeoxyribonuclease V alpha subunit